MAVIPEEFLGIKNLFLDEIPRPKSTMSPQKPMKNQGFGRLKTILFTKKKTSQNVGFWGADGGWWLFPTHLKNLHPIGSPPLKGLGWKFF